jgi:hypothetical protein
MLMNILFYIFLTVVILTVLALIIAFFGRKAYVVSADTVVDKSLDQTFSYVRKMGNQKYFNKWVMTDPNAKFSEQGVDGEVGFVLSWDSENKQVGAGSQKIVGIELNDSIHYDINFIRPFEGIAHTRFELEKVNENQTKVIWAFQSSMKYPSNIFLILFKVDRMLQRDMEVSMRNLKTVLEG